MADVLVRRGGGHSRQSHFLGSARRLARHRERSGRHLGAGRHLHISCSGRRRVDHDWTRMVGGLVGEESVGLARGTAAGGGEHRGGQPMIRLARRTILLVALCLLASATTANAECAWVLWSTAMRTSIRYEHTLPADAYKTKEECDRAYDRRTAKEEERRKRDPDRQYFYICLPDTVDPRGPKGK